MLIMYPSEQFLLEEAGDRRLEKDPSEINPKFESTLVLVLFELFVLLIIEPKDFIFGST